MKIKPKEVMLNIPVALMFRDYHEIPCFAANINEVIHGKLKYEELGCLAGEYVGLFYFIRNDEFHSIRKDLKSAIEQEEIDIHNFK